MSNSELAGISFHSTSTYTLVDEIGRGGMGIVFLAEKHTEGVNDYVVLKTVKTLSKEHESRLKHEANIATMLRHENIVKTYGMESLPVSSLPPSFRGEIDSLSAGQPKDQRRYNHFSPIGQMLNRKQPVLSTHKIHPSHAPDNRKLYFIAMDYVQGPDLQTLYSDHLEKHLLIPCELTGFIISRICRALGYAHQYIIHRDISPGNILINNHGVCKLSDFGVAAQTQEEMKFFAGKLAYMSPEQIKQEGIDTRTDIFSLGLVAYELITGIHPYTYPRRLSFEEQRNWVIDQMSREIIPPHQFRTDIPESLSLIIMKMLAKDKNKRYQNMIDVGDVLEQKYLYAQGFGPTNNSLSAYIDIFYSDFKEYKNEQLRQLNFLKGEDGNLVLTRNIRHRYYTPEGLEFIKSIPETRLSYSLSSQTPAEQPAPE
ncbi:MAG: serine/threonine-protein kinase [Candidatus Brocadiia bacterium]